METLQTVANRNHKTIRIYIKNLHSTKLKTLKEIYKFLDECDLLKLNQDGINNLNKSITSKKIEAAIKSLSAKTAQDLMGSLQNSTRVSKKS